MWVPLPTPAAAAAASSTASVHSKKGRIWPGSVGALGILSLIFYIIAYVIPPIIDGTSYGRIPVVMIITLVLMIVLFFVHTRQIPWITILPFLIYIIMQVSNNVWIFETGLSYFSSGIMALIQIVSIIIPMILFVFYVLITLIRPHGPALKVLYIIFLVIEVILLVALLLWILIQNTGAMGFGYVSFMIAIRTAIILFHIGYGIAAGAVRPRTK